jgi:hypothetical protein
VHPVQLQVFLTHGSERSLAGTEGMALAPKEKVKKSEKRC